MGLLLCAVESELVDAAMNQAFPSPFGYIHYTSMSVFNAVPFKGMNVKNIHYWFLTLFCMHRDLSRFFESFKNAVDCKL